MKTVRSPKFCSFGVFYFRVFPHYQKSKFASQKSKNKSIEKTFFVFPKSLDFTKVVWYCVVLPEVKRN